MAEKNTAGEEIVIQPSDVEMQFRNARVRYVDDPRLKGIRRSSKAAEPQMHSLWWSEKDRVLTLGTQAQYQVPHSEYALIIFLSVLWQHVGGGSLTNRELAAEYDSYCERIRDKYKANEKIPKYLRARYRDRSSKAIGKMADRCLKKLHDRFGIPDSRFFPIQNQGSLNNGQWVWHKVRATKPPK